jgi:hypothetical protein
VGRITSFNVFVAVGVAAILLLLSVLSVRIEVDFTLWQYLRLSPFEIITVFAALIVSPILITKRKKQICDNLETLKIHASQLKNAATNVTAKIKLLHLEIENSYM